MADGLTTESSSQAELTSEDAWRDELSVRLSRYRARRKAPPPRYPSLKLPFETVERSSRSATKPSNFQGFESASNHALALNELQPGLSAPMVEETRQSQPADVATPGLGTVPERSGRSSAKIIEFPGFSWGPPTPPPDQLAEPVFDRPRILEVPEVTPPPPALGGITIEPAPVKEAEKRPGIDIPLQSAPLGLRVAALLIDGLILTIASSLFGFIFWKITAFRPPQLQLFSLATGVPCLFWAAYQYLLIVYSGTTPGLRLAGLELTRFDGTGTTRSLRRWRILASYLSGASLGMGYAWLFLDEDALCWHDRITHTYLAPRKR
ncbi:MAG TPA: RDD family protein [Candidatus Sulfotelmatobacter sp.]|nr:RDD family protein [Candidatus Sulfotelmatobacter sp.]